MFALLPGRYKKTVWFAMQGAVALSKHLALPCAQCRRVLRRILSRDRPAAGIRHNDATLKSLPNYRGLLAIALLSLARRM